jgi:2-polyprenyl-3-methyl-5-hydroxy-6-metoxy-1,4-benzoquinol methylase
MSFPACRLCGAPLRQTFADLGVSPLSNSFLLADQLNRMEPFYPLHARVCEVCFLVQLEEFEQPESIFSEYAYFSSYSESWLQHVRAYADRISERFRLTERSLVVEVASNDGYLLQYFVQKGIPVLGVEPAQNVAAVARKNGIQTVTRFFGEQTASDLSAEGHKASLIVANNVLAHVPDVNGFVKGLKLLLKPAGIITVEFPHLLRLIEGGQFDTIYHEHFSYFSFCTAATLFERHDLSIFDVEELPTHGGSLRLYISHAAHPEFQPSASVGELRQAEIVAGIQDLGKYAGFEKKVRKSKRNLLQFLLDAKNGGKTIVGYGAPAKGNTLLNYCGVGVDFLDYTVDLNPHKQNHFLPGTHIPIHAPEMIRKTRPDYVVILPWNLRDEIISQLSDIREWGGRLVVPIPTLEVIE